jgi:hypothetical protein
MGNIIRSVNKLWWLIGNKIGKQKELRNIVVVTN